jgi:hypothetical protein
MQLQKSRYTGVFNAYYTIGKFEGMAGLYKGDKIGKLLRNDFSIT